MTEQWSEILCIIIVATITIANLFAIRQKQPETLYGLQ